MNSPDILATTYPQLCINGCKTVYKTVARRDADGTVSLTVHVADGKTWVIPQDLATNDHEGTAQAIFDAACSEQLDINQSSALGLSNLLRQTLRSAQREGRQ